MSQGTMSEDLVDSGGSVGEQDRAWVVEAWTRIGSSSVKERRQIVYDLLMPEITSGNFTATDYGELAHLVFSTLDLYRDRSSARLIEELIVYITKQPDHQPFLEKFLELFNITMARLHGKRCDHSLCVSRSIHYTMLRWSALLVKHAKDWLLQTNLLSKVIIPTQELLLYSIEAPIIIIEVDEKTKAEKLVEQDIGLSKSAGRCFSSMMKSTQLHNEYAAVVFNSPITPSDERKAFMIACLSQCHSSMDEEVRKSLLNAYTQLVALASRPASAAVLYAFDNFIASLRENELNVLIPNLVKSVRRNSVVALVAATHVVDKSTVDPGVYSSPLDAAIIPSLKSDMETVRSSSVKFYCTVASRTKSDTRISEVITQLLQAAKDRRSKPEAVLSTLQTLASVVKNPHAASVSITSLLNCFPTLPTDALANEALTAISNWSVILREGSDDIGATIAFYIAGINDSKKQSPFLLSLACSVCSGGSPFRDSISGNKQLIDSLVKIAETETKIQSKLFCRISALTILIHCNVGGKAQKAMTSIFCEQSFMYDSNFIQNLSVQETRILLQLWIFVLTSGSAPLSEDEAERVWRGFARLTILSAKEKRQYTIEAVKSLSASGLEQDLVRRKLMSSYNQLIEEILSSNQSLQEGDSPSVLFNPSLCLAVKTHLKLCRIESGELVSDLLRLICHPVMSRSVNDSLNLYKSLSLHFTIVYSVRALNSIQETALSALYSKTQTEQLTGIRMMEALARILSEEDIQPFVEHIVQKIEENNLLQITEEEQGIFTTPEGDVYDKSGLGNFLENRRKAAEAAAAAAADSSRGGKGGTKRGGRGGGATGRDKSAKSGPTKEDMMQKVFTKRLEEESVVRDRIMERFTTCSASMNALTGMLHASPSKLSTYVPLFFETVFSYINNPLLESVSCLCLRKIGSSCKTIPQWLANRIYSLLIMLYGKNADNSTREEGADVAQEILIQLEKVTSGGARLLSGTDLYYSFPALQHAVVFPLSFRTHPQVLQLVKEQLADSTTPAPRQRIIDSLFYIVDNTDRLLDRCYELFAIVCDGVSNIGKEVESLFSGNFSSNPHVRKAALLGLQAALPWVMADLKLLNPTVQREFFSQIWIACFDPEDTGNAEMAKELWSYCQNQMPSGPLLTEFSALYNLLVNRAEGSPQAVPQMSEALCEAAVLLKEYSDSNPSEALFAPFSVLTHLFELYTSNLPPEPVLTPRGYEYAEDTQYSARTAIAVAVGRCAKLVSGMEEIKQVFDFLMEKGPLIDGNEEVREEMVNAGVVLVNTHANQHGNSMLSLLETYLAAADGEALAGSLLREATVIFMGTLALYFPEGDPNCIIVLDRLLEAVSTPSIRVQQAISECLMPLIQRVRSEESRVVNDLFGRIAKTQMNENHIRNGLACSLAGVLKGLGILSFSRYKVMERLQEMLTNKKSFQQREAGLMTVEYLSITFDRLFEPFIVRILDPLLNCFSDSSVDIRSRAAHTSKSIMRMLKPSGVSYILPSMIEGLNAQNWRSKKAAIELLGSMAFCAPRQLSLCLPQIVPRLVEMLSDSHTEVQKAGQSALSDIASVVRNPEIQAHIPLILKALDNPSVYSNDVMEALIHTKFVHVIEAPSLALIIPMLERGLRSGDSIAKRNAAQIIGHMTTLADHKDLLPYLETLLPNLKLALSHSSPETRTIAAVAVGHLVSGLGEDKFPGLMEYLLNGMKAQDSTVFRSGAAQGLSQLLSVLPMERFEKLLPSLLLSTHHESSSIREGSIGFFVFAPGSFGMKLSPYLQRILPNVLRGFADEVEYVRDMAMRAAKAIISQYAISALDILLPSLEDGLFQDNWRIRKCSVQLLGDLLFRIAGEDASVEDVTNFKESMQTKRASGKVLEAALGGEKHKAVLAALYMTRSDVSQVVRQQAIVVWKTVVENTPRTLSDILPILMQTIVQYLGSSKEDKRYVACKTMGELVRKLSDKVLPSIMPILKAGLDSEKPDTRQGVCLALTEVLECTPRSQLTNYLDQILTAVRHSLCDELKVVRDAASQAFDMLFNHLGTQVIDEILPILLDQLQQGKDGNAAQKQQMERAILGIREILGVRSNIILPHLLPQILQAPITEAHCNALISVSEVSGPAIYRHLTQILVALVEASLTKDPLAAKAATAIMQSIREDGMHLLFMELMAFAKNKEDARYREAGATLMEMLAKSSQVDIFENIPQMLQVLIAGLLDPSEESMAAHWRALAAVLDSVPKEKLPNLIGDVCTNLSFCREQLQRNGPDATLPAFCHPSMGIAPVLPLFQLGLRSNSAEWREQSARGISDVIHLTSKQCLQPHVRTIIGALIRGVGDRFPGPVKAAMLQTMGDLLGKSDVASIKAFLVMMQTTFIKALHDSDANVRKHAGTNLGLLIALGTKVDPLVNELLNGIGSAPDEFKDSMVHALYRVLCNVQSLTEKTLSTAEPKVLQLLDSDIPAVRQASALLLGVFCRISSDPAFILSVLKRLDQLSDSHTSTQCLTAIVQHAPHRLDPKAAPPSDCPEQQAASISAEDTERILQAGEELTRRIESIVTEGQEADRVEALEALRLISTICPSLPSPGRLIVLLSSLISVPTPLRLPALNCLKAIAKTYPEETKAHMETLVPLLMERVKDRSSLPVKLSAERVMLHCIQIKKDPKVFEDYMAKAQLPPAQKKIIKDYCTRVLSKLPDDSDEEEA